jgi:hypothetical protein
MDFKEAVTTIFKLFEGNYGPKFKLNENTLVAWTLVLEDCDPNEILATAVAWVRSGKEWPASPSDIRRSLPSNCRCDECGPCRKRRAHRIMSGQTKRLYGSGGAFFPAPDWASAAPERQRQLPESTEGDDQ